MAEEKKKDVRRVVFPASFIGIISLLISIYVGFIWTLNGDIFIVIAIFCGIVAVISAIMPNTWWADMGAEWFENLLKNGFKNLMGDDKSEKDTKTENKVTDNQTGDVHAENGSAAAKLNGVFNAPVNVTLQSAPTIPTTKQAETIKEETESDKEIIEKSKKKLDNIREKRLRGNTPKEMPQIPAGPRIYLHIVPYNEQILPLEIISKKPQDFSDVLSAFREPTYNPSGILFPSGQDRYLQIYDKGCVEYLYAGYLDINNDKRLFNSYYEYHIIRMLRISLATLKRLGAKPPFFIMLSIIELDGYSLLHISNRIFRGWDRELPIREKDVLSNPVIIQSYDDDIEIVMKPSFQKLWRAAGQPVSLNYDGDRLKQEN